MIDTDKLDEPKTRSEAVYRQFRQDILWGKLKPGAPLKSDELRQAYGVGISPLREALSRLVSEHLVTLSGQRGFRVTSFSEEDVIDTMETRLVLESEALVRSMRFNSLEWETGVVSSFHALSRIPFPGGPGSEAELWSKHHREYHMALVGGCKSPRMKSIIASLFDHAERHRVLGMMEHGRVKRRDPEAEHRQIMEATLSGNEKAAVAALDYHYRTTADLVVKSLRAARDDINARKVGT